MNSHVYTLLGFGIATFILFAGSLILFFRERTVSAFLQLLGAVGVIVVVLTHAGEVFHLLPWMGWGCPHSAGHYLDFASAILALTLFPVGYLLHALTERGAL